MSNKYKSIEDLFLTKYDKLENENEKLKNDLFKVSDMFKLIDDGKIFYIENQVELYVVGTNDSKNYYETILKHNNISTTSEIVKFLKTCLYDNETLLRFMEMKNTGNDYVCQVLKIRCDILTFKNTLYRIDSNDSLQAIKAFKTEIQVYRYMLDTIKNRIRDYLKKLEENENEK